MSISKRKRFQIFKRDNFTCQYCGKSAPQVILEADHILPASKGGGDESSNLVTSCFDCNRGKSAEKLDDKLEPLQEMMLKERVRAEQLRAYNRWLVNKRKKKDASVADVSRFFMILLDEDPDEFSASPDWCDRFRYFLDYLPAEEIKDALEIMLRKMRSRVKYTQIKYFSGVCWRKIKGFKGGER